MLLAAGRGERLRPLTDDIPKALVEVNGVSLLERHLTRLGDSGVRTVVINLGWLGDRIVERIGSGSRYGLQVVYSPEYENILETGGGIYRALPLLGAGKSFWVINADIVCDYELNESSMPETSLAHLVLVPNPDYRERGDFDLVGSQVANTASAPLTFSGIARYRPEFFADCETGRFSIAPLLRQAADSGNLSGELYEGYWADVGTPSRLATAEGFLKTRSQSAAK
ncbi:MAG: nucleotidyltransferase family protein [Woeseia sp.]|nr:nucleotidyltransferase family protein [Woeseia sp.]MBT8096307.1 nucleotidyltransferase family protein [Woeseia sp.]